MGFTKKDDAITIRYAATKSGKDCWIVDCGQWRVKARTIKTLLSWVLSFTESRNALSE